MPITELHLLVKLFAEGDKSFCIGVMVLLAQRIDEVETSRYVSKSLWIGIYLLGKRGEVSSHIAHLYGAGVQPLEVAFYSGELACNLFKLANGS